MTRASGQIVGRYRLQRQLGAGGMGEVWRAQHAVTARFVALKFLRAEHAGRPEVRARFLREAKAACAVEHPSIVPVHDVLDIEGDSPALVMDMLEGESLAATLQRERVLSPKETASILLPVVGAVKRAHAIGIVHRDLKPENIFLCKHPDDSIDVKVLDFGIAKLIEEGSPSPEEQITKTGSFIGTPEYMSPEQARSDKGIDARTDVWSLGVILYECLTGSRPTAREDVLKTLTLILTGEIPAIATKVPEIDPALGSLLDRMLSKDPAGRPSLEEVTTALETLSLQAWHAPPTEPSDTIKDAGGSTVAADEKPASVKPAIEKKTSAPATDPPRPQPSATRSNTPWLLGLLAVGAAASISVYFRYTDADKASTIPSSVLPTASDSPVELADSGPMPLVIMTLGEDSDANIDPIADRAEDISRCLEHDRTCIIVTHTRGIITAVMPEEDDEKAAQCAVQALEGAILDEGTPQNVRICITRTR